MMSSDIRGHYARHRTVTSQEEWVCEWRMSTQPNRTVTSQEEGVCEWRMSTQPNRTVTSQEEGVCEWRMSTQPNRTVTSQEEGVCEWRMSTQPNRTVTSQEEGVCEWRMSTQPNRTVTSQEEGVCEWRMSTACCTQHGVGLSMADLYSLSHGLAVSDPVGWVSSCFLFVPSTVSVKAHWSNLHSWQTACSDRVYLCALTGFTCVLRQVLPVCSRSSGEGS